MLRTFVSSRYVTSCHRGAAAGALCALAASAVLYWYYARGPAAGTSDSGEAYGYSALMLGEPFSFVGGYFGIAGLVLSAVVMWSIVGAIIAGVGHLIAHRIYEARHGIQPPAG